MKLCLPVLLLLVAVACKKEDAKLSASLTDPPARYMPHSIGNYWIYERFQVEADGAEASLHQFDSVYVEKDTMAQNKRWWKIRRFDFMFQRPEAVYIRDSLHYLLRLNDPGGRRIELSSEDFSTVFMDAFYVDHYAYGDSIVSDTLYHVIHKMTDKDRVVTTQASSFKTINSQQAYYMWPNFLPAGVSNPRCINTRYAEGVGVVVETEPFFTNVTYMTERRLVRYHLN